MNISCTLLIPFYNEGERVLYTLEQLSRISSINSIICIDDGSTDNASENIYLKFPKVEIITLRHNRGKATAIYEGLKRVETDYVLLFDADLSNIKPEEVETAIHKMLTTDIDMIILRRIKESKLLSLIRHDVIMSGQRIVKAQHLFQIFQKKPIVGYALEVAINSYMIKNHKKVYWMPITTQNPFKLAKWGFKKSYTKTWDAFRGYISYGGVKEYLKQIRNFCTEEAPTKPDIL